MAVTKSLIHLRLIDKNPSGYYSSRPLWQRFIDFFQGLSHSATSKTVFYAQVVKLVDTPASGAGHRKGVEVQVLSWAPLKLRYKFGSTGHLSLQNPTGNYAKRHSPLIIDEQIARQ